MGDLHRVSEPGRTAEKAENVRSRAREVQLCAAHRARRLTQVEQMPAGSVPCRSRSQAQGDQRVSCIIDAEQVFEDKRQEIGADAILVSATFDT